MAASWIGERKACAIMHQPSSRQSEKGQGMLEYGMIIVLVAILVMVLLLVLGPGTGNMFSNVTINL
jgi:pilus assembly protein Flp/PilA